MNVMELIREQTEFDAAAHALCESWLLQDAGEPGAEDEARACREHTDILAKTYGVPFARVAEVVRDVARARYEEAV